VKTLTTKCTHDPLYHYLPCAGCAQDEIAALRARVEIAEAKAAVIGGEWCAENRAAGRDACGACAWCCQTARAQIATLTLAASRLLDLIGHEPRGITYEPDVNGTYNQRVEALFAALPTSKERA